MEKLLNGLSWRFMGFHPWVPLLGNSLETGISLKGVTDWVPATVPGGVHYDLYRAGYIEHPHHGMNSLKCEWVENRWWLYETTFACPEVEGKQVELVCKGLDYRATIILNDVKLGQHEGMFHPAVFDITSFAIPGETLKLQILFENAPEEMAQIGRTSMTHTQKSRFNYKWDFSTRMVNLGIWDDILLRINEEIRFDELYLTTDVVQNCGTVSGSITLKQNNSGDIGDFGDVKLMVTCKAPGGQVVDTSEHKILAQQIEYSFIINMDNPQLWYPNGYGDQPLYEVELQIVNTDGHVYDIQERSIGIRKLGYTYNVDSPEDALPYTFMINDTKIYIKGVNMTPLDLLYGNVTPTQYEWVIYLMKKANINLVRVWGGGIIEKSLFYDLCDRHGIMIWQEFIQSSSGVDSIPSKLPGFLELLEKSAVVALKERRNHVSLTVWSGGNELTDKDGRPSTYEDENIALLKALVEKYDPTRMFLPTSASGPVEFITLEKGISHDVHGNWKYGGNPGHYELYGNVDHLFHSEFGMDGMSSLRSLRKFMPEPLLTPRSMNHDLVWRHHGEWWDTFDRDQELFGELNEISSFVQASQWIQAEGLRYIVEANRRRKFKNSGSIIWQVNEPWPNVSSTSLLDYYGEQKMVYHWIRKAYAPLHVSMNYQKLNYSIGELFDEDIYVHTHNQAGTVLEVQAEVMDFHGHVYMIEKFKGRSIAEQVLHIGRLSFHVSEYPRELFFVKLKVSSSTGEQGDNLYVFSRSSERIYASALQLMDEPLEIVPAGEWKSAGTFDRDSSDPMLECSYTIRNPGKTAKLHIYPEELSNCYWMEADRSFETLFPGESMIVKVHCRLKQGGGLLTEDRPDTTGDYQLPVIRFSHFGEKGG
ncbi:glycoside hydrolase family 2 protein [Paenibacillus agaridevorans]|uniref:glycoside hydrolase family 2 protein n=1 Tax=Paenibacillus agaridevorans TaxID=171404 RepID=UPI001BE3FBAD|nr:glycoside hydrolase family 2 TIM barrel-domain containing protein [Paenibacillus agaridevorans]